MKGGTDIDAALDWINLGVLQDTRHTSLLLCVYLLKFIEGNILGKIVVCICPEGSKGRMGNIDNELCPEVLTHLRCNTAILTAKWCNHHSCPSAHITHMHEVQGPHHRCSKQYGICLAERKRTNMNHEQLSWHKNDNQAKHTRRLNKTIRSKTATDEPTKGEQE